MTTYLQMAQYGKEFFIPAMKARGFNHYRTFNFVRIKNNGICDLVGSQILSSKERMRLWCHVWVPEFETDQTMPPEKCNAIRAKFPNWGDAWAEWKDLWTIKDEEEAKASLVAFLKVFDKFVLPWFDSITTGDALLAAAGPHAEVDPIIKAATSLIKEKYSLPSSHELFMLDGNRSYMAYGFAEADRVLQDKLFDIQVTLPEAAELPLRLQPSFGDAKKQPTKLGDVHRFMGKARLFSERAVEALRLAESGRLFPVELQGRTEKFFWYWSTTIIDGLDNTLTKRHGSLVMEPVFLPERIGDAEIFTVPDDQRTQVRLYVNDVFKERIRKAKLKGFLLQRKEFDPKPWKS